MRVIIAGSRHLTDTSPIISAVATWRALFPLTEVVVGGAPGTDQLAEYWAKAEGLPVRRFPADWRRYGRGAGPVRNRQMAAYADGLIALPFGRSIGTRQMIAEARKSGLEVLVIEQLQLGPLPLTTE